MRFHRLAHFRLGSPAAPARSSSRCLAAHFALLLLLTSTGVRALRAQDTPLLIPLLDGTSYDLGAEILWARFGYANNSSTVQTVPYGGANYFDPDPIDRGQPYSFLPGTYHNVFGTGINLNQFSTLSWTLGLTVGGITVGVTTVTASRNDDTTSFVSESEGYTQSTGNQNFPAYEGERNSTFTLAGGAFTVANATLDAGATLNLNQGSAFAAGTSLVSNGGTVVLNGGALVTPLLDNEGGTVHVQNYDTTFTNSFQNHGILLGTGGSLTLADFTNPGTVTWQGGALSAPTITNPGNFTLSGGQVTATTSFANSGILNISAGGLTAPTITNAATGDFTISGGHVIASTAFANADSLNLTGGVLTTPALTGTGTLAWSGGTIELTGGNFVTGGPSLLGANPALTAGQTLQLDASAVSVGSGHTVSVGPGATLITQGGNNAGTFYVTGGILKVQGSAFTNAAGASLYAANAALRFTGDGMVNSSGSGGAPPPPMMFMGAGRAPASPDGLQNSGTLTLAGTTVNGDVTAPATSHINVTGQVAFNGLVNGAANFDGSGVTTFNGGYLPEDSGPALVTHAGGVTFGGGNVLTLGIAGLTRGSGYDALNVGGMLTFGGTFQLALYSGFTPAVGEQFNFFDFTAAAGTFNSLNLPTLASGLTWDTSALYTTGVLSVDGAVPTSLAGGGSFTLAGGSYTIPSLAAAANATFTVAGGSLTVTTTATLADGATLNLNHGGTVAAGTSLVNNGGTVVMNGGALDTPLLDNEGGTVLVQNYSTTFLQTFQNHGTLHGLNSFASLTLADFTNPGTVNWQNGVLIAASVTNTGAFTLSGGQVTATASFASSGSLRITGGMLTTASLTGSGSLSWTGGTIELDGGNFVTDGASLLGANPALTAGQVLYISAGAAQITTGHSVSVGPGATLVTQGGDNAGTVYVSGGTLTSQSGAFTNAAGATFYGTNAALTFTGDGLENSTDGLQNLGTLTLVDSTVNGDLNSPAGSLINIAGHVTFAGFVSGAANIAGSGLATFAGGYAPGDPVLVSAGGGLAFAGTNTLVMQMAGLTRGTGYDAFNVTGALTYGGTLQVELINGFTPTAGDSFDLFDYTTATGTLSLPALAGGLAWNTADLYSTGVLGVVAAVPEPAAWALLAGLAVFAFAFFRRQRSRRPPPAK